MHFPRPPAMVLRPLARRLFLLSVRKGARQMEYLELIGHVPEKKFAEIFAALPRKNRITLEALFGTRRKKKSSNKTFSLKAKKPTVNAGAIHTAVKLQGDNETAGEILRTYLFKHRTMLRIALDSVGIENDDGITNQDLDELTGLSKDKVEKLAKLLVKEGFSPEDVAIYLVFMEVDKALHAATVRKVFKGWGADGILPKLASAKKSATTESTATEDAEPKKAAPKKAAPKKTASKKAATSKAASKKAAPSKAAPKRAAPKNTMTKKAGG